MKPLERWLGRLLIAFLALVVSAIILKYVPVYASSQVAYDAIAGHGTEGFIGASHMDALLAHLHIKIWCEKVEKLTAIHAINNAIFFLAFSIFFVSVGVVVSIGSVIAIPCMIVWGICTGDWGIIGLAFLFGVLLILASMMMPLAAILLYLITLFQWCTPGYFLLWLPLGFISFALWAVLGWAGVFLPTAPEAVGYAVINTGSQIIEVPVRAVSIFFR
jgi:hypothetical protein